MHVSDLLNKIAFFEVSPDLASLSAAERQALSHCVRAADLVTEVYLRQVSSDNPMFREQLAARTDSEARDLLTYFELNGGPWDQFNANRPFLSNAGPKVEGGSFYPSDLNAGEWEQWLVRHPEDRSRFENPLTVIRRSGDRLVALPYNDVYRDFLEQIAKELRSAASLLPSDKLSRSLLLRADALLSNDYWDSDVAWVDTDGYPFEVTLGPYESYTDDRFGIKAAFEALLALPDRETSEYLRELSSRVPAFDRILADRFDYRPKGSSISLEVVHELYRGGEASAGRCFTAFNLPNDRSFQEVKGSKNVLSRTMMEAKFTMIGAFIAERLLKNDDLDKYVFNNRMLFVLTHELAHGIGPGVVKHNGREININILLRDLYSPIEEVRANVLGAALLQYLVTEDLLESNDLLKCVVTEVVGFIQDLRLGYAETHSISSMVQYNWLKAMGALKYDRSSKVIDIDGERALVAMTELGDECIRIQLGGSYERAKAFVERWRAVPQEIVDISDALADLPYEVRPIYHLDLAARDEHSR